MNAVPMADTGDGPKPDPTTFTRHARARDDQDRSEQGQQTSNRAASTPTEMSRPIDQQTTSSS